jgi:ribosome-binding ATPase YchF (GTP1/OBG family)
MKICVIGIPEIHPGRCNIKDPRLDKTHELVEAKKKAYAQVDVVGEEATLEADSIVVRRENLADVILKDLEFVETRLGRNPSDAERAVLLKLQTHLEAEQPMSTAGLSQEELQAIAAHGFHTNRPVTVAGDGELQHLDALMLRAFGESGYISFLTVGGSENRAWPIRKGITAWEAAGTIHSAIQKGFIRAEIIGFQDFLDAGGETEAKRAGKLRLETKQYVMQDYDLVNFRTNK